jgi:elongator complex protein 3
MDHDFDLEWQEWQELRKYKPEQLELARLILEEVRAGRPVVEAVRRHPLPAGGHVAKHSLVAAYRELIAQGEWLEDPALLAKIRMKPVRTLSGVTTVTVLTQPYPCPGKCIFCPTDVRMPKSYLPDEPGARRALQHQFDPYTQVSARLEALDSVGHPTDKIELLVLGGTWSAYRRDYQELFIRRCFEALNGSVSATLEEAHLLNETARHRNVGLVIETRPDEINPNELAWLRRLGVTKVQMGAQSLDDRILELNRRGHTVEDTQRAVTLLRAGGFKIVLHWMPNLLGATLDSDRQDFARLWEGLCPDEIKIYPNQLLANADLYLNWLNGEYQPYTTEELTNLIADLKPGIPRYCRVNRVIRDIPSTNVVEGNKRTSLRQDVHEELKRRNQRCRCVRCREVRGKPVDTGKLVMNDQVILSSFSTEHFLSFDTPDDHLAGFLRLSLPGPNSPPTGMAELEGAALIREVHVYGQSLQVGKAPVELAAPGKLAAPESLARVSGAVQHSGLGTRLIERAEEIAREAGYRSLAVISAVGTRLYYEDRGFQRGELYWVKKI